jgi:hypothetical protein
MPPHGFFDWKAIKGQNASKPYAIAMKDGGLLSLGGFWENCSGAGLLWERRLLVSRRMVDEVDHTDALAVARAGRSRATPVKTMLSSATLGTWPRSAGSFRREVKRGTKRELIKAPGRTTYKESALPRRRPSATAAQHVAKGQRTKSLRSSPLRGGKSREAVAS